MNKFVIIVVGFIIITGTILICNFFGIETLYYLPYVFWMIALLLFYITLDSEHINIFMNPK